MQFHCDYDNDRKITETEWNMCVGVKKGKLTLHMKLKSIPFILNIGLGLAYEWFCLK